MMASSQESDFQLNLDFNYYEFLEDLIGPLKDDIEKKEVDKEKPWWNACILWDGKICEELNAHEDFQYKLHTSLYLGRFMSQRVMMSDELAKGDFPGMAAMNWRKQFIMLDIVNDDFGICGINRRLRVQQTVTYNSPKMQGKPALWDLVIYKECESLANEMVRRFNDGIKTTLVIWGAHLAIYDNPWIHHGHHVKGEILLKSTKKDDDSLSVLISHREMISEERRLRILRAGKDSELWNDFQDERQECTWFGYSSKKESQVVLHVMKKYKKEEGGEKASVNSISANFRNDELDAELLNNVNQMFAEMEY